MDIRSFSLMEECRPTPLMEAAIRGDVDRIKSLLESKASVNFQDKDGWGAIHFASSVSHSASLKSLLQGKADVNLKQKSGHTPLHIAISHIYSGHPAVYAKQFDCVNVLLKAKADVNIRSDSGDYVLAFAAYRGNHALVKRLLLAKADVNAENYYGHTALSYAINKGDIHQVNILLKAKANSSHKNNNLIPEYKNVFDCFFPKKPKGKKQRDNIEYHLKKW